MKIVTVVYVIWLHCGGIEKPIGQPHNRPLQNDWCYFNITKNENQAFIITNIPKIMKYINHIFKHKCEENIQKT